MEEGTKLYTFEEVESLFKAWRKQKKHRSSPIPPELWEAAISLAKEYSMFTISNGLRLDFNELKKRIINKNAEEESTPVNFIELNAMPTTEVTVHIERPDGVAMRVSIKDKCGIDIIELGRAFWSNR